MNLPILYFSVCLQQQHDMVTIMKTSSKQAAAEVKRTFLIDHVTQL